MVISGRGETRVEEESRPTAMPNQSLIDALHGQGPPRGSPLSQPRLSHCLVFSIPLESFSPYYYPVFISYYYLFLYFLCCPLFPLSSLFFILTGRSMNKSLKYLYLNRTSMAFSLNLTLHQYV